MEKVFSVSRERNCARMSELYQNQYKILRSFNTNFINSLQKGNFAAGQAFKQLAVSFACCIVCDSSLSIFCKFPLYSVCTSRVLR